MVKRTLTLQRWGLWRFEFLMVSRHTLITEQLVRMVCSPSYIEELRPTTQQGLL